MFLPVPCRQCKARKLQPGVGRLATRPRNTLSKQITEVLTELRRRVKPK